MAVVKVIEVIAQSSNSFEDAVKEALKEASKSVQGIQNIYVKEMQVTVENEQITVYRVNAKVSFLVGEG